MGERRHRSPGRDHTDKRFLPRSVNGVDHIQPPSKRSTCNGQVFSALSDLYNKVSGFFGRSRSVGQGFPQTESCARRRKSCPFIRGIDKTTGDCVDSNVTGTEFFRQGFGESTDAAFRCRVSNFGGGSYFAPNRRDVYNFAILLGEHGRNDSTTTVEYRGQIAIYNGSPLVVRHILQQTNIGDACVVDE